MANIIKRVWNQNRMVQIEDLKGMIFQAEKAGHTFQISGIDDDRNTVALTGTPSGVLLRPDNTDVALTCSVSGGVVSATLPADCYDVPGRFGLTIFITSGGSKTAIYAAVGTATRTSSGTAAPGTTQSVVDLINAINAAVNSIPASYSALLADIAPTYSNSALYSVGQYAWYDGDLKRCIVPITTAESYTAAHWTSAVLGQDVSDLKSATMQLGQINYRPQVGSLNEHIVFSADAGNKVKISTVDGTSFTVQQIRFTEEDGQYHGEYWTLAGYGSSRTIIVSSGKKYRGFFLNGGTAQNIQVELENSYFDFHPVTAQIYTQMDGLENQIIKSKNDEDRVISGIVSYSTQYLDFSTAKNGYYPSKGNFVSADGYKAIEVDIPAGDYFIYGDYSRGWCWIGDDTLTSLAPTDVRINNYNCTKFTINAAKKCYLTLTGTTMNQLLFNSDNGVPVGIVGNYNFIINPNLIFSDANIPVESINFVRYSKQYIDPSKAHSSYYWNSSGNMVSVADEKWIAFDAFDLLPGIYYAYNVGAIYGRVNGTVSEISLTDISGISYMYRFTLSQETEIMVNARFANPPVVPNTVCIGNSMNLPSLSEKQFYNLHFLTNALPSNIIIADASGNGDYTTIQDAIDNIRNDTEDNPYTILVMPGTYGRIDTARLGSQSHALRYISIIGTDRDRCIIYDDKGNYDHPSANIRTNGTIRNLSFINKTDNYDPTGTQEHAYAVHEDFGLCDVTYENCYMYCEAGPAIGIGMVEGKRIKLRNCEFISNENEGNKRGWMGAIFAHSAPTITTDQGIEIKDCIAVNKVAPKGMYITCNGEGASMDVQVVGTISFGTEGANAYFEGNLAFGCSGLNNFEIPSN